MTLVTLFTPLGGPSSSSPYVVDQVLVSLTSAGSTSIDILAAGKYQIEIVGGGGGLAQYWNTDGIAYYSASPGGTAAAFAGIIRLNKGTYTVTAGGRGSDGQGGNTAAGYSGAGGSSTISLDGTTLISAGGGGGATAAALSANVGSAGTLSIDSSVEIVSYTVKTNGASGSGSLGGYSCSAAASRYNGYGAGGGNNQSATSGCCIITYKGV